MNQSLVQSPATSQRERKRLDTRERIFDAAVSEFERVGFAQAQIPLIAEAAGVVRGTFYFHFPSKDHVLMELAERDHVRIAAELAGLRGRASTLPQVLDGLIGAMTSSQGPVRNSGLLSDLLAVMMRTPGAEEQATELEEAGPIHAELTHHVLEAIERGEVRGDVEAERLASTILTSIFGVIVSLRSAGEDARPDLELMVDLLMNGMRPASGA